MKDLDERVITRAYFRGGGRWKYGLGCCRQARKMSKQISVHWLPGTNPVSTSALPSWARDVASAGSFTVRALAYLRRVMDECIGDLHDAEFRLRNVVAETIIVQGRMYLTVRNSCVNDSGSMATSPTNRPQKP